MSSRIAILVLSLVSSLVFFSVFFTGNYDLLGILAGFVTGLGYYLWLARDAKKAYDKELAVALKIYYKSFFSRLGMVTLVVAAIGRYMPQWLLYLALGIAGGIIIPLIAAIKEQLRSERG